MVTRAQLIRRSAVHVSDNPENPSWYLKPEFWDFMLNILGMAADVLRIADKPVAATTVERVVTLVQKQAISVHRQDDLRAAMRMKLQILSKQLQASSKFSNPSIQARTDAQIELIAELLNAPGSDHGQED